MGFYENTFLYSMPCFSKSGDQNLRQITNKNNNKELYYCDLSFNTFLLFSKYLKN